MRHTYSAICGVLFILAFVALFTDILSTDNQVKKDSPTIELRSNQKLPVVINGDTSLVYLAKGDSVKILGFSRLTYHQSVLVETTNGDRGELDASQLPIKQIVVDGKCKGDTIVKLKPQYSLNRIFDYIATTASGEELKVGGKDIAPIFDGWEELNLENNASTSVTTKAKLQKMQGKTLEEIEKEYGMAYNIFVNKDRSKKADFRIYAYGKDGKNYRPSITFDTEGQASEFQFEARQGKANNSWLLGNSLVQCVIELPFVRTLTRSSSYSIPSDTGKSTPWYLYVLVVLQLITYLLWFVATPSVIVLLIGWLIAYRHVFYPLSNKALKITIILMSIICTIIWLFALMAWGMHWSLTLLVIPASYYCTLWATEYLNLYVPHQRCPRCKRIHTIAFDHDEVTGSKYMKGADIKRDKLLGRSHSKYQTWTEVTTTKINRDTGERSTSSHRENIKNHKMRHDTYRYIDFEVTYLVTFYKNHFICSQCKYHETNTSTTQEEVDRKIVGSHVDTESYEV